MLEHKMMKAFVVFAVVLSFLFPAMATSPGPVSGKWSGAISIKNEAGETQSQPVFLILTQDGKKVSFDVVVDDSSFHSAAQVTENELTGETVRQQTNGVKITFKLALKR